MWVLLCRHLTATQGNPWVPAGLGVLSGGVCARAWGTPASRDCLRGLGPPYPAALGQDGSSCCPLGLLLWDAPAPFSSSAPSSPTLPVFPPMCDYQRMAQPWPCGSPADSGGSVFDVAHGLNPTPFQVHCGKCQVPFEPCCHQWCRCH